MGKRKTKKHETQKRETLKSVRTELDADISRIDRALHHVNVELSNGHAEMRKGFDASIAQLNARMTALEEGKTITRQPIRMEGGTITIRELPKDIGVVLTEHQVNETRIWITGIAPVLGGDLECREITSSLDIALARCELMFDVLTTVGLKPSKVGEDEWVEEGIGLTETS